VFGPANFRNEIIWSYRRWTNSTDFLQRSHQSIYFYAKSKETKINQLTEPYSPTTNLDQIWQKRTRSEDGKSITKRDANGDYEPLNRAKSGVPLRDVWDIPYLNPTAKERVGYPTQKPVELLERIVLLST
jgi:site-specific DNA-methyltransferase (adenine-specific)